MSTVPEQEAAACGCGWAAAIALGSTIAFTSWAFLGTTLPYDRPLFTLVFGGAVFFAGGVAGKLVGLSLARRRSRPV